MTNRQATELQDCGYPIEGPKVGYNVVAWRSHCRRKVRVPAGTPGYEVACWQHTKHRRCPVCEQPDIALRLRKFVDHTTPLGHECAGSGRTTQELIRGCGARTPEKEGAQS